MHALLRFARPLSTPSMPPAANANLQRARPAAWAGVCALLAACFILCTDAGTAMASDFVITASAGAGGSIAPSGAIKVSAGNDQAFAFTPDPCDSIQDVVVDGVSVGHPASWQFTNVQANHTISVTFAPSAYTITATATQNGVIVPSGRVSVACGGSQTFFMVPDQGHSIHDVIVDGVSVGPVQVYSFPNVTANHDILALFQNGGSGRGDDVQQSLGQFRVVVEPQFWTVLAGYPGFNVFNGVHRLLSPLMYDPSTVIGRSDKIAEGDADDVGGVGVGTANTMISDANISQFPAGFEGAAGTAEIHTEVHKLNMVAFDGSGTAVRAGLGMGLQLCPGEIEGVSGSTSLLPGNSFFNIFAEVDLPTFGGNPGLTTLYNPAPLVVENDSLTELPPTIVYIHRETGPAPLLFKSADPSATPRWQAGDTLGWLVLAGHGFNFDTLSTGHLVKAPNSDRSTLTGGINQFLQTLAAESEMASVQTRDVDAQDVVTFAPAGIFLDPAYRDSLLDGINAAHAANGLYGPCAALPIVTELLLHLDGAPTPPDWVVDGPARQPLYDRINDLAAAYQTQANLGGGCGPVAVVITRLETETIEMGVRIKWAFADRTAFATVAIERSTSETGPWADVSAEVTDNSGVTVAEDRTAVAGQSYFYRLVGTTAAGAQSVYGPVRATAGAPRELALSRAWPNPTRGSLTMRFAVPRASQLKLTVVDLQGREVAVLANGTYTAGHYQINWDGRTDRGAVPAGLYFVRLMTPDKTLVNRVTIAH